METQFSWTKQWYPISPLSYLDSNSPNPVTLLGKKLVIWQDNHQQWIVMDDYCPHKLAQLSLGRINEDGNLMCRHHGWTFNNEGQCTNVPMLTGNAKEIACNSLRSHVKTYPTQVLQGLLWIWPDDSATAFEDCQLKNPATIPECDPDKSFMDWHMTEVPVGYTVSVESTFDPSHAQYLHEGSGYYSPETAVPIKEFSLVGEMSADAGFHLKHSGYNLLNQDMEATRNFTPPCANTTIYRYANGKNHIFQLYFVPTKPGQCRHIVKFIIGGNTVKKKSWLSLLPNYLQIGLQHLLSYKVSDQDLTVMHSQEMIETSLNKKWQKAYFMPSPADLGIVTFRKWLDEFAGGAPSWQDNLETTVKNIDNEQLYDRWHRHTKFCPNCRRSVILLDKVQAILQRVSGLLALLTLALIIISIPAKFALFTTILSIISLLGSYFIDNLKQQFFTSIPQGGLPIIKVYADRPSKSLS
ncbi:MULTISPECIES: aromatic ring-hydroxylating dioxygenase subunit alpha [Calothrix]|uniref:Rieske 2Fe-2S domain-containing protein n=2 Tax=Calothrix TaxID=1186 RepID=A0ABR8A8R0_9CYAN|nr:MULTISPECIES: Rieske 2Fe-2S domain-containing protein [Calothrix]MBD2196039.1 Rieske 2Fe-2S domain-containing protein [Calothrix parietina FACHB-288]MBD2224471.1 Rieske 2Fe-2S domain-containing protein [Calothrix anomala FACHB-343]